MNETLEAMARAVFRDWFVDFGPTRAKMEGRAPYLSPTLWPLFPSHLTDQGIPEGWEHVLIGQIADIKSGKRPPSKLTSPDLKNQIPVYGGNGISWYTNEILFNSPFLVTGRVGTLGTVFRVYENCWVSDNALCCFPHNADIFEILFFHLTMLDFKSLNSGSTQPLLTQTALKAQKLVLGGAPAISAFSGLVKPIFSQILRNEEENQTLAQTRDLLLPKLLSGEIRLPDPEETVEATL